MRILHMYCGTLEVTDRHPAPPDCWEEDYHTGAERGNLLLGSQQKSILSFFNGGVKSRQGTSFQYQKSHLDLVV